MTSDDSGMPSSGAQPPYGIPPQQAQYGQPPSQQPPYFPPPQRGPAGYQPPQQYQWQQPGGQPPRPPRKPASRTVKIVLAVLGSIAAIMVIAVVASAASKGSGNSPSNSTTSQPPAATASSLAPSPAAQPAALSNTGADGDFKFTVTSWSCGQAASAEVYGSADGFATQPAGTTECVAMLSVTNVHDGAQQFFQTNQYAINLRGQKLSADDNTIYASGPVGQDAVQVNPGQTVSVGVAYAVPNGETIAKLELHDSAFSGGVDVKP